MPRKKAPARVRPNEGKPRWSLLFRHMTPALLAVVRVAQDGAARGAVHGWLDYDPGEVLDSAARHLTAAMSGEHTDPTSGSPHWAHLAWNALAYGALQLRGPKGEGE